MADYTQHQKGIIRRYYEHRDTLALQKLAETVSNLYVETSKPKVKRAWSSARAQMVAAGVPQSRADEIADQQDLEALAKVVEQLT
jgi:hypothetical protein